MQIKNKITSVDILVPVYNEEDCLVDFINRLYRALNKLPIPYQIIFVDDGSTDTSLSIIKNTCKNNQQCGYIHLSRNFGKEAAMSAGIKCCQADALVIIDADLQDPPELIPKMIQMLEETQADVVFGRRKSRQGESFLKKKCANMFYRFFDRISKFDFPRDTGDFRVIRKRVVKALQNMKETNRFMKGLFAWVGYEQVAFLYDRDPRYQGRSKFNFVTLLTFALDGITSFSIVPIRLATVVGMCCSLFSILFGLYFLFKTVLFGDPVAGFPTLIIFISFFSGVQLLFLGIIGEYVARTNLEVKRRPLYLVDECVLPPSYRL